MANQFIEIIEDKFTDSTIIRMKYANSFSYNPGDGWTPYINGRLTLVKDKNAEVILLILKTTNKDWLFLREGNVILRIDDKENITLTPHELSSDVEQDGRCREECSYEISKEVLTKLCKAEKIEYKISSKYKVVTNENNRSDNANFGQYCRRFYNGVYDENAYVESLEIKQRSGCMIATLIGVASLAALSSGAYYLISSLLC